MADFLIAYGSQTGQAETIAKSLQEKAELIGLKPRLFPLDENEKKVSCEAWKLLILKSFWVKITKICDFE